MRTPRAGRSRLRSTSPASLHRRGYRGGQGAAPLKENLAAAISCAPAGRDRGGGRRVRRPDVRLGDISDRGGPDRRRHRAGAFRERFGFERWKQHDAAAGGRSAPPPKRAASPIC
jgi:23S rRNA (guanine2445-N2)-methyltransferase / 23S rRNA (guanine2069-N7)-methyltransferase